MQHVDLNQNLRKDDSLGDLPVDSGNKERKFRRRYIQKLDMLTMSNQIATLKNDLCTYDATSSP